MPVPKISIFFYQINLPDHGHFLVVFLSGLHTIQATLREDDILDERILLSPNRVAELLDMCLRSTYLSCGGEFYDWKEGAAMFSRCLQL